MSCIIAGIGIDASRKYPSLSERERIRGSNIDGGENLFGFQQ
jgi:hypothetical protein